MGRIFIGLGLPWLDFHAKTVYDAIALPCSSARDCSGKIVAVGNYMALTVKCFGFRTSVNNRFLLLTLKKKKNACRMSSLFTGYRQRARVGWSVVYGDGDCGFEPHHSCLVVHLEKIPRTAIFLLVIGMHCVSRTGNSEASLNSQHKDSLALA